MGDEPPRIIPLAGADPKRQEENREGKKRVAFRTGISAESRAAAFLIAKGFRILARRWKSPVGEIDTETVEGAVPEAEDKPSQEALDVAVQASVPPPLFET